MLNCDSVSRRSGAADGHVFPTRASPVPPILGRLLAMAVGCEWRHGRTGKRASRGDLYVEWDQL